MFITLFIFDTNHSIPFLLKCINRLTVPFHFSSLCISFRALKFQMCKVHRGTLHEMIKNNANKCAKQSEIKVSAVSASVSVRQQTSEVDNRHALSSTIQKTANKYNESTDGNDQSGKPLSKKDLIKKFDSKYNKSESIDNKQSHRTSYEESQKIATVLDDVENDENIQNSNNEEINDVDCSKNPSIESESTANNNYKNGNIAGANANGNEVVPPKPLPRTSRNNSVSSISSEHSISISNAIEETARPVAKPRTTATSYKVQHAHIITHVLHRFCIRLLIAFDTIGFCLNYYCYCY